MMLHPGLFTQAMTRNWILSTKKSLGEEVNEAITEADEAFREYQQKSGADGLNSLK